MISYGRAPTFLMTTGYEQVPSIAAYLAGDLEAARRVELDLPETGVCSSNRVLPGEPACCTPMTPQEAQLGRGCAVLRHRGRGESGRSRTCGMKPIAVGDRDCVRSPGIRPQLVVVSAIGLGQILAWRSSYYLTAIIHGSEAVPV